MNKFIEITLQNSKGEFIKSAISIAAISTIAPSETEGTTITFIGGEITSANCKESYNEIMELICK